MAVSAAECPFRIGDVVYFAPDATGYNRTVMMSNVPALGAAVTITDIRDGHYIVWGGAGPMDALHYDLFSPTPPAR